MSEELNIVDSSINLFSIDKPVLLFQVKQNNNENNEAIPNFSNSSHNSKYLGTTSLIITNLTSDYLAFRTKTTKRKYYSVFPSYFILAPNKKEKINFSYFIKEGEKISNEGHKFKFEAFVISPEEKDKDARKLFHTYISQKTPVKATLVQSNVAFIEKETNDINDNNNKDMNSIIPNPSSNNTLNLFSERSMPQQEESLISKDDNLVSLNNNKNNEKKLNLDFHNDFGTPKIKKKNSSKKMQDYTAPKTQEEKDALLNKLKVEYFKLKNELDILKNNYYNLRNNVDLDENENEDGDSKEENIKDKYSSVNNKEIKFAPSVCFIFFILAIILGFYLS